MTVKVFIVTGASKGIGAAVAHHLLQKSHKVVLAARTKDLLESTKQAYPGHVEYEAGDMTQAEMARKLVDLAVRSFGKLDGIVLNHGVLNPKKIGDASVEDFKVVYDVNVFSCLAVVQAGLPELRKSKGCVLWVSSGAAAKQYTSWGAYGSSKAAVNSISAHLAVEEPNITSLTISPGRVDTDMQAALRLEGNGVMDKSQYDSFVEAYRRGELLKPEQPGSVIAEFVINPSKELSGRSTRYVAGEEVIVQPTTDDDTAGARQS